MAKELNNLFITAKNVIGFPKYLFILKNSIKNVIILESMVQTWMEFFPTRIQYILKKNSILPSTALGCYL